jgi:predicted transcriptional regulator
VRIYYKLTKTGKSRTKAQIQELLTFLDTIQELILNERPLAHG